MHDRETSLTSKLCLTVGDPTMMLWTSINYLSCSPDILRYHHSSGKTVSEAEAADHSFLSRTTADETHIKSTGKSNKIECRRTQPRINGS